MNTKDIGIRIKERRKELKMSADELGKRIGKDRSTIYRYENGDIENVPLDMLEPLANALEISQEYLIGWKKVEKKADTFTDIVLRMKTDPDFLSLVETLNTLDSEKINGVRQMLSAFGQ